VEQVAGVRVFVAADGAADGFAGDPVEVGEPV
jgi:hypothetical protein